MSGKKGRFSSRRGVVLPSALLVMLLFAILCVAMFTLSHMGMAYDLYFERRAVLEHATVSMATALARKLNEWSGTGKPLWEDSEDDKEGSGFLNVGDPAMKFTFRIVPPKATGRKDYLRLSVWGEYAGTAAENRNMAWLVSLDVPKSPLSHDKTELLDLAFGSPDAHVLWKRDS
ncbi:MAG: hypothetical protein LBO82_00205 [Synergistaceae bacterium]|jgi:hypothetical protein|nr:hypothetical protein [Synergistaceae bacterium]